MYQGSHLPWPIKCPERIYVLQLLGTLLYTKVVLQGSQVLHILNAFVQCFFCSLFRVVLDSLALILQVEDSLQFSSILLHKLWAPAVGFSYNDYTWCHEREGQSFPVFKVIFCPLPGYFPQFPHKSNKVNDMIELRTHETKV